MKTVKITYCKFSVCTWYKYYHRNALIEPFLSLQYTSLPYTWFICLYLALLKITDRGMGIMSFAMMTRPAFFLTPAMNLVAAKVSTIVVDKIVCNCSLRTGEQ